MEEINLAADARAFIFDVDGTLYQQNILRRLIYPKMARYLLSNPIKGMESIISILSYRRALEKLRSMDSDDGILKEVQFEIASNICSLNINKIENHVSRWMREEPIKLLKQAKYPYLDFFLKEAKRRDIKLAVFSDYPVENKIDGLDLSNVFDLEVSSQDLYINKLKPDPKGIEYIIEQFGLESRDVIYFGDRYGLDTRTAFNAGVRCVIIGNHKGKSLDESICIRSYRELYCNLKNTS